MKSLRRLSPLLVRRTLFVAFTLSGFAGLIYESIWSHYLKLLLGHAAYAQTLVLVLFMGGMAIGSKLCGEWSARIKQPLLAYCAIEVGLGVFAMLFDPVFRSALDFVIQDASPALGQPLLIEALKWTVAAFLILPACVLLGATFPLISAGVVRLDPQSAGNTLGWLYFTNSLGAVAGVLASGFVLIAWVGLPGTLLSAGLCNIALAIVVYGLARRSDMPSLPSTTSVSASPSGDNGAAEVSTRLLIWTAFLTGAASFLYEIGWIRMLSLVLGSATHSFELMLAAFILGLALGALWVRNHIDGVSNPVRLLAFVQIVMGTLALCSLVVYGWSFDWMAAIVRTIAQSDTGYAWFLVLSQGICIALMIPVTFFAGITLPVITAMMMRATAGESAIGRVYAANTLGAITGVIVAVHFVMPVLGLRNVVVTGALIDIALGLLLLKKAGSLSWSSRIALAVALVLAACIATLLRFEPSRLVSGVYRYASAERKGEVLFHKDGRTASIDVTRAEKGTMTISTNGKPDAGLAEPATGDDYTMILLSVLPLAIRPDAETAAVIGLGSGRSTHVLLGSSALKSVDTIEIEPAMAEGARLFGPYVERTFNDPRSHLRFEDAKTFFSRHRTQYDLILSEPSNPWVSGVASLYTEEFYQQVKQYLTPDGLFVQWLQIYEFDDELVASVGSALDSAFEDYIVYATNEADLVIIAAPRGKVGPLDASVLGWPNIRPLTESINIHNVMDLEVRRVATKATASPYFAAIGSPANSDYFPFLDQRAARTRFLARAALGLSGAHPVTIRMEDRHIEFDQVSRSLAEATVAAAQATGLSEYISYRYGQSTIHPKEIRADTVKDATTLARIIDRCDALEINVLWLPTLERVALRSWPYLNEANAKAITQVLRKNECPADIKRRVDEWLDFLDVVSAKEWEAISKKGAELIARNQGEKRTPSTFLVREVLLADYRRLGPGGVALRASLLGPEVANDPSIRYLRAISGG